MASVIAQHHVEDFDRWLPFYKEHGEVRRAHGGTGHQIFRTTDDPNELVHDHEVVGVVKRRRLVSTIVDEPSRTPT